MSPFRAAREPSSVAVLVSLAASAASALLVLTGGHAWEEISARPADFVSFALLTLALQLMAVEVYGRGAISVSGIGLLAAGFTFGTGAAMQIAVVMAAAHAARRRVRLHRAVFNAATFSLAAGAGTGFYQLVDAGGWTTLERLAPALFGGALFWAVNIGLLSLAMSLAEGMGIVAVWRERFRWLTVHYLAFGPLALASTIAYEKIGITGLLAFALPPALLIFSVHQYLDRTRVAVEEARGANRELRRANAELAKRNEDLHELFQFAGGLAARAHDRCALVGYAEESLGRLLGGEARISVGERGHGLALRSGGAAVGWLQLDENTEFDAGRWGRLREAIVPQLGTAIESAELIERVRKTHLDTIAALSRSMEAKDYYTGGHTERVAHVAVALGARLGYAGPDLDAIEIGALLHDIGKIGIPERILHKPGPLDPEEWKIMKEHPVISEYILSEVDLSPIVLQIARSSHERIDGKGYPDGLEGDEIPLPARIVLVADAVDALTSDRPYRRGRHVRAAIEELRAGAGTQFCPTVVAALEDVYRDDARVLTGSALPAAKVA